MRNSHTKKGVCHVKAAATQSAVKNEELSELIKNLTKKGYPMNFVADVSNHVQSIELRNDPVIIRVNRFDEESAREFAESMSAAQNTGQTVVPVVIDSFGGQVYALMSMIGAIRSSRIPVATIVEGKAMSCGAILFSFGADGLRFMDPDATLMIHDVSSAAFGKIEEMKTDVREAERLNNKVYKMMAKNCGKPESHFLDIVHGKGHADWYLDAKEAKEHNLANELRLPTFSLKVELQFSLI
jgi:ATP-dependent protease ClpP protease subunit